MPEKYPPIEPVKTRGAFASDAGGAAIDHGRASYVNDRGAALAFAIYNMHTNGLRTTAAERTADMLQRLFRERTAALLDDLAEVWWTAEHAGTRVRPFSSLPIADRAELRARVKKLLTERVADALGDQAVLEAEKSRLLDLPARALTRTQGELERAQARDPAWRGTGAVVDAVIFAAGQASVVHIGDCRTVRLRRGRLESLTREHTLAHMFEDSKHESRPLPEDVPQDVLVRMLGMTASEPDVTTVPLEKGDIFLLATSSLTMETDDAAIAKELRDHGVQAAPRLVAQLRTRAVRNLCAVAVEIL